jgi:AcrR family transcriptional regulator
MAYGGHVPKQVTAPAVVPSQEEPLREKRRRELRQQLSDVATRLFLEHGFDAVKVADVARACGVTVKTVYNHFPSKESLLADRWEIQAEALRQLLLDPATAPVDAALEVLGAEIRYLTSAATGANSEPGLAELRRFGKLIQSTPSLMSHNRASLDRLTSMAALTIAQRTGTTTDEPEPWITATAIAGLWPVFFRSLRQHLALGSAARITAAVEDDLRRAAVTLRTGL